ncbi:hypothetical protein CHLNCDRAFT_136963 [Chlorella variabilis]|uniref:Uncharacterized protein n=1 Tax=Chlorella variabilis TaxID=554065 RepID=E1ZLP0_CHLVA|nr:hypothetical protein CHLNCDRAFT_136963 [Chlorella variabilis]EFN53299.1 hypothetical protein CHLNCDRAFT_136963 [Chlorella variabilis]|eukprot:XP_005845401.1 hypothetical protein CHLNCDRAFT_136963 [Chlorella variabilis]
MPKRKAAEALPASIAQEPASTSGTGPFVVYFPSRFDPKGGVACEWQTYAHSERKNQYMVVAKTKSKVDFVGSTSHPEYSSALPCRYALGLFSRRSGKLEVMPAEGGKILRLEPRVRGESYEARGTTTVIEQGGLKDANMRLVEEFGSQRRKRQLKAREAGKVEAGHVSAGAAVLGMIASVGAEAAQTKEEVIRSSLAHRNIPPHHADARSAGEAYRSDEIVPLSFRDALEVTKLFPAENKPDYRAQLKASGMFGAGYVFSRLGLLSTQDRELREERCRMLTLLGHLLKLQQARWGHLKEGPGGLEELAQKVKAAPSVLEGLLSLFYTEEAGFEGRKYLMSKEKRSLLLGWILVLAVRCLADELKVRPGELVQRYRELGCVDVATTTTSPEGTRTRGHRVSLDTSRYPGSRYPWAWITLMPQSAEEKTLGDYFPALKLGGRKR